VLKVKRSFSCVFACSLCGGSQTAPGRGLTAPSLLRVARAVGSPCEGDLTAWGRKAQVLSEKFYLVHSPIQTPSGDIKVLSGTLGDDIGGMSFCMLGRGFGKTRRVYVSVAAV
jgi:hypothetical protein